MGGDHGPPVILSAVQKAIQSITDAQFILCGDENIILPALESLTEQQRQRTVINHCEQIVEMGEPPTSALRNKKQSSMWKALQLVESGEADACVSAGNTGALLTMAFYLLKTLPGIDRPALVSDMPTASHHRVFLLDLGANVNCTSEILFQYERCNEAFDCPLHVDFCFSPVQGQQDAEALPEAYDPVEVGDHGEVNLLQLFEDELILSLPIVPFHAEEDCAITSDDMQFGEIEPEQRQPNPFAVLKELKRDQE